MDVPRIQYAKTEDGVSIAFWTLGSGPALVIPPVIAASHLDMAWRNREYRVAFELLATRLQVVCYDCRGAGLSQRDALDFSIDGALLDLEAVADRLELERFAVYNDWRMGGVAFACAASRPDRVSHLVHWWRALRPTGAGVLSRQAAIESLMETDWEMYTEITARLVAGWDSPAAGALAASIRSAHTPASFRAASLALRERSIEPFLPRIQAPTLLLHPLDDEMCEDDIRLLASSIANARAVALPVAMRRTGAVGPFPNQAGITAILDFICASPEVSMRRDAPRLDTSSFRTILFSDLSDHTGMMQRLGDWKGRELLREHERITREVLAGHGGDEIKAMGDGFMASFGSAQKALECAVALQRRFGDEGRLAGHEQVRLHIGVNAGEPIAEDDDLFGTSVIMAARVAAKAAAGEILATNVVRELMAGKGFLFTDRGEMDMKGFEEPVRLYEVRWQEAVG